MTKYIKTKDGKMAGSVGNGASKIPSASAGNSRHNPTMTNDQPNPVDNAWSRWKSFTPEQRDDNYADQPRHFPTGDASLATNAGDARLRR